ncbi:YidB family protein [Undibacterium griseum]|uniref:DUF937 domain-containing protein n=1 Tax=Undibacterium griseum TaxID=2762295 RepID=A0ABR6YIV5_9BURK|nr:YidB family protein [Undibacterium griseum]MBC3883842.1 DUF937 domain-containing protein [Undibacterium griseum]
MGLFDSIAGQVLGSLTQTAQAGGEQHAGLLEAVGGLINNPQTGGLTGLISAFEEKGLGGLVASWVGTGENLPISAEQLQSVLGNEQVQEIAQKLGFSPEQLSGHLTQLLPQVIDHLTPGGVVPEGGVAGGVLGNVLGLLQGGAR